MSIANIVIGPIIIAIIFGFIVGSRVHLNLDNSFKFTASGILALIIGALIMDVPIATTFLGAVIGVLIGSALLGGRAKGDH